METFTVKVTKIYFSKWKRKSIKVLFIVFAIPTMIFAIYNVLLGQIPIEIKVHYFSLGPFDFLFLALPLIVATLILLINFSNKNYDVKLQINEKGISFKGDLMVLYPWTSFNEIRASYNELQVNVQDEIFWIKFKYTYEKLRVESLVREFTKINNIKFEIEKNVP